MNLLELMATLGASRFISELVEPSVKSLLSRSGWFAKRSPRVQQALAGALTTGLISAPVLGLAQAISKEVRAEDKEPIRLDKRFVRMVKRLAKEQNTPVIIVR